MGILKNLLVRIAQFVLDESSLALVDRKIMAGELHPSMLYLYELNRRL